MTTNASIGRTLLAGVSGGITLNIVMVLTFRLLGFGWDGGGILISHSTQSPKLIAIWTELEPIPLVVANPAPIVIGLILFGIGHAFIYRWLSPAWPQGLIARALRIGMLVFFLSFFFWEFFTPFNLFGEPLPLIGLELVFWATIAFAEASVIASVFELKQTK
jgi:hypothetical protein